MPDEYTREALRTLQKTQMLVSQTLVGLLIQHGFSPEAVAKSFHATADAVEQQGDLLVAAGIREMAAFVERRQPDLKDGRKPS